MTLERTIQIITIRSDQIDSFRGTYIRSMDDRGRIYLPREIADVFKSRYHSIRRLIDGKDPEMPTHIPLLYIAHPETRPPCLELTDILPNYQPSVIFPAYMEIRKNDSRIQISSEELSLLALRPPRRVAIVGDAERVLVYDFDKLPKKYRWPKVSKASSN